MKIDWKKDSRRLVVIILSSFLIALNIKTFVRTGGLFPGGASGLTLLIQEAALKYFSLQLPYSVINILLNLIVIPRFKSVGAATTSLCVQALTAFLQYLLARRILKFNMGGRYWMHILLFLATTALTTLLVKQLNLNWIVAFLITFAINCGAIFFTRLVSLKEIVSLVLPKEKKG